MILVVPGMLFRMKLSPSIIAAAWPESLNRIFNFSLKFKVYFNSWSFPASTCDSKPFAETVIECSSFVLTIVPVITPEIDVPEDWPSLMFIIGWAGSVKSINPVPAT